MVYNRCNRGTHCDCDSGNSGGNVLESPRGVQEVAFEIFW